MGSAEFVAIAYYEGREVGRAPCKNCGENADVTINLVEAHLWELGEGRLYDLKLIYGEDEVTSYFGLRSVQLYGMKFRLNGKSVFQRTVLDQGYYPDGLHTAPSEAAMINDSYDNPELQKIQLWILKSELIQAVGRVRILKENCTVKLYASIPLPQAIIE